MGLSPSSAHPDRNAARRYLAQRTEQQVRRHHRARLARYIAGKCALKEGEFKAIAKALSIEAQLFARAWAASLGLTAPEKDAVSWMVDRARSQWRQYSPIADRAVPSRPSPMAVIRAKYADRLPLKAPPLRFGVHFDNRSRNTPANRAQFVRAYEMLVDSVHRGFSARDIGALRGISGERARQLMVCAAHTWAKSERIDLFDKSVPFKNEAKSVKNLYAGLRFFAQQQFKELTAQRRKKSRVSDGDDIQ